MIETGIGGQVADRLLHRRRHLPVDQRVLPVFRQRRPAAVEQRREEAAPSRDRKQNRMKIISSVVYHII